MADRVGGYRQITGDEAAMRILVSLLNYRPGRIGGTETYLRELIPALARAVRRGGSDDQLYVLLHEGNTNALNLSPDVRRRFVPLGDRAVVLRRSAEALRLFRDRRVAECMAAIKPDVTLYPQQSIYPHQKIGPSVLVVHDLIHLAAPEGLPIHHRVFRGLIYHRSLDAADHIIAISQDTADQLAQRRAIGADRITVVPHGYAPTGIVDHDEPIPSDEAQSLARLPRDYLYYPAATHPHKGHGALLNSLAQLRVRGRWSGHLVLSGIQTSRWPKLRRRIDRLGLRACVHHVGYVSYAAVRHLYQHAFAVVFPSRHEGFGLPVVEATAMGCKLVTSRLSVFDELGVPGEARIDFEDPNQLARALARPGATRLTRAPATWDDVGQATLAALRRAAAGA